MRDTILEAFSFIFPALLIILVIVEGYFVFLLLQERKKSPEKRKFFELGLGSATVFLGITTLVVGFATYDASKKDAAVDLFIDNKTHFNSIRKSRNNDNEKYYTKYWEHSFQEWFSSVELGLSPKLWDEFYKYAIFTAAHRHVLFLDRADDTKYRDSLCKLLKDPIAFGGKGASFGRALQGLYQDKDILDHFALNFRDIQGNFYRKKLQSVPIHLQINCHLDQEQNKFCSKDAIKHGRLAAQQWMNASAEYYLLLTQQFEGAIEKLNKNITLFNRGKQSSKKWAVIIDADETVLDNSPYDSKVIRENEKWTPNGFSNWCQKEEAKLLPGAYNFLKKVNTLGGSLFVVTDREENLNSCTTRNFEKLGIKINGIYTKSDNYESKASRWSLIESSGFEILLWVGDQATDFPFLNSGYKTRISSKYCKSVKISIEEIEKRNRKQKAKSFDDYVKNIDDTSSHLENLANFNSCMVILPNPSYGQWVKDNACIYQ